MEDVRTEARPADEQSAEVERVKGFVMKAIEADLTEIVRLTVSKGDGELFGKTEFELRDLIHRLGSHVLEAVVLDRKKGGIKAAAPLAHTATAPPGLSSGGRRPM